MAKQFDPEQDTSKLHESTPLPYEGPVRHTGENVVPLTNEERTRLEAITGEGDIPMPYPGLVGTSGDMVTEPDSDELQPLAELLKTPYQDQETNEKSGLGVGAKIALGVGGIAAVAGGVLFALSGDGDEARTKTNTEVIEDTPSSTVVINPIDTPTPTADLTTPDNPANLDIVERKIVSFDVSGSSFVDVPSVLDIRNLYPTDLTVKMQKGESNYDIPTVRDPNVNANAGAESIMALWACYLTTGDDGCLTTLTDSTDVKNFLKEQRDTDYAPRTNQYPDIQASFIDRSEDPAEFKFYSDGEGGTLELNNGTLMYGAVEYDPEWQTLAPNLKRLERIVDKLVFQVKSTIDENGRSTFKVTTLNLKTSITPSQ